MSIKLNDNQKYNILKHMHDFFEEPFPYSSMDELRNSDQVDEAGLNQVITFAEVIISGYLKDTQETGGVTE